MKTESLIIQDFGGVHNGNPEGTRSRLMKGGSWKRQRVIVIIPSADMMHAKVALSLWNLIFPPNQAVVRILALGCEVGIAYSSALEQVMAHPELSGFEVALFCEHDNLPPQDGLLLLLESLEAHPELSAISGLYFCRGEGGCAQIWGTPDDPMGLNFRPQVPRPNEVQECCGIGQGFAAFRLSMFKDSRLRRPWFKTLAGKEGVGTQDLYFWGDARKYGYRCGVDTRVKVGHMDLATGMIW